MAHQPKLQAQLNPQGWKQFLTGRKELLDAFDRARTFSKLHEVETYHGVVAEAQFRKWLSNFLPKKFAVTSGYIISQGLPESQRAPHFDVIIYDAIQSPVLWVEDHSDVSEHGRSRAIPAEYVAAVLEVKPSFHTASVKAAIDHLKDLEPLLSGEDSAEQPYKVYLPKDFCCGVVFFEIKRSAERSFVAMDALLGGVVLRNFMGAIILRGEGRPGEDTAMFKLLEGKQEIVFDPTGKSLITDNGLPSKCIPDGQGNFLNFAMMWMPAAFSNFTFDLLALMNGSYRPGFISSYHGFGTVR